MSEEREKLVAAMRRLDISTHGETFDDLLEFFELSVAAAEGTIRRDERERCATRINALIAAMDLWSSDQRWYAHRMSALMAARSAVMRGDDAEVAKRSREWLSTLSDEEVEGVRRNTVDAEALQAIDEELGRRGLA